MSAGLRLRDASVRGRGEDRLRKPPCRTWRTSNACAGSWPLASARRFYARRPQNRPRADGVA